MPMKSVPRMPARNAMTVAALRETGSLKAVTPSLTASSPVRAAQPDEKARRIRKSEMESWTGTTSVSAGSASTGVAPVAYLTRPTTISA